MSVEFNNGYFQALMGQTLLLLQPPIPFSVKCYATSGDFALMRVETVFAKAENYLGKIVPNTLTGSDAQFRMPFVLRIPEGVSSKGTACGPQFHMAHDDSHWFMWAKADEVENDGTRRLFFTDDGNIIGGKRLYLDVRSYFPTFLLENYPSRYKEQFGPAVYQLLLNPHGWGRVPFDQKTVVRALASAFVFILPGDTPNSPYEIADEDDRYAQLRMSALRKAADLIMSAIQIGDGDPSDLIEDISRTVEHFTEYHMVAAHDPNAFRWNHLADTLRTVEGSLRR